jgi:hypothetical protein
LGKRRAKGKGMGKGTEGKGRWMGARRGKEEQEGGNVEEREGGGRKI